MAGEDELVEPLDLPEPGAAAVEELVLVVAGAGAGVEAAVEPSDLAAAPSLADSFLTGFKVSLLLVRESLR
ncbi:hypothetical protein [Nakamurella antarctica]|uniref:hypothetical protein n=1 Tax=Nakamurella antarctica TaxID=1902245 RepID=UPI001EF09ECE|nr:hypothetical protein [Nakamurella antarctica]